MTTLIVFGASSDLMRRKIAPAVQALREKGSLPSDFQLVGFGRRPWSDADFQKEVTGGMASRYVQGQFLEAADYEKLKPYLGEQTLFYLAVAPLFYEPILERLATLTVPEGVRTRILIEKPFGNDGETAEALDKRLGEMFNEEQIYRVDHYLAKDVPPLDPSLNHETVSRIEINLLETMGVERRGAFYDATGALRDWHSHHLQILASLLQGPTRKSEVLNALPIPDLAMIESQTQRMQYKGYREIEGVDRDSKTETAFRLITSVDLPRWKGVPIHLAGGKKMPENRKEVVIHLRDGRTKTISLESAAGGTSEYEALLKDAFNGDQTRFVSTEEVKAMWRFVDPIVRAWQQGAVPLHFYP